MSSHISSEYIDEYNMTAEEYANLSSDEQQAINEAYVNNLESQGLSDEEIEEKLDELKEELSEIQNTYANALDDLENLETGSMSDSERQQYDKLMATLESIIDELKSADDDIDASLKNYEKLHQDYSDGADISISDAGALDGSTTEYITGGGGANPFGDTANYTKQGNYANSSIKNVVSEEEYLYLLNNNIIDESGVVIADQDGVEGLNYNDIKTALQNKTTETVTNSQKVFINTSDDEHWTLVSADESTGTYVFKVEDEDGNYCYKKFIGATDVIFCFSSGINSSDIGTLKGWPTSLLKHCIWGDGTSEDGAGIKTFYDELYPSTASDSAVLGAIDGYSDVYNGYSEAVTTLGNTPSNPSLEALYQQAIDLLYSMLDDPTQDINDIWSQINALCTGLNRQDKATLIKAIVLGISKSDPTHLATFIPAGMVTTLETYIRDAANSANVSGGLDEQDKLVVMILESQCGAGLYGPDIWAHFSPDGTKEGDWKNHEENSSALTEFNKLFAGNASAITAATNESSLSSGNTGVGYKSSEADALQNNISGYVKKYAANELLDMDGTTEVEATTALNEIVGDINELWASGASVEEIREKILSDLRSLAGANQDDVACLLMALLKDKAPTLYNQLFSLSNIDDQTPNDNAGEQFRLEMGAIIFNGGDAPAMVDPVNLQGSYRKDIFTMFPEWNSAS